MMPLPGFIKRISLKKALLWAGGGFLAFVVLGALALPPIVRHFAARVLEEKFHRPVAIRELHINPLRLAVTVGGFTMREKGGSADFIAVEELHANLEAASLFEGAPVLRELRVKSPSIRIVRNRNASYNIDDIIAELLKPSDSPARYSLNNIQVEGGRITFDDQPQNARHLVSDLKLLIPFLSNLPYEAEIFVKPTFAASVNGAPVQVSGELKPFSKTRESSVNIAVSALDLARYFEYVPLQQDIALPAGKLDASLEIDFSQPPGKPPTVALSGKAALHDVRLTMAGGKPLASAALFSVDVQSVDLTRKKAALRSATLQQAEFHLPDGKLVMAANEARMAEGGANFSATAQALSLRELAVDGLILKEPEAKAALVEIGALALRGGNVDLAGRNAMLDEFATSRGTLQLGRNARGEIDLLALFARPSSAPSGSQQAGSKPWQFALKKLSLAEYGIRFTDAKPEEPVNLALDSISIEASDISSEKNHLAKVTLGLQTNKTGSLAVAGSAGLNPLAAKLGVELKGLKLKPFQPYFTDMLSIILTDGAASAKGELSLNSGASDSPDVAFRGDAGISRLAAIDKEEEDDFLKWNSLSLKRIDLSTQPPRIDIAEIALTDFYSRLIINEDGTLNLQSVLKPARSKAAAEAKVKVPEGENVPVATPPGYKVNVARFSLRNGQVDFSDYFINPNYDAHLTNLGGAVTGLSSDPGVLAEVGLNGRVDNQGQLDINGRINPLAGNLFLDLVANLKDFELSSLEPYSAKYAGYGIQKGKLSFDVKYKIENRQLVAENHLFLNQLTFGDKVESPQATKLPVLLAVALLKDRNGNIDINLPISGSLDDPQFSVGGLVIKVIVNLVVKAVTAPFALIGSLFGGGEELDYLAFAPGRHELDQPAEAKLASLARALQDRPGLKLDIAGQVDPASDVEGLKRAQLEHKVKAQKFKELLKEEKAPASVDEVKVESAEYARYLTAAYKQEKIPNKPRNLVGLAKDLPVAEMEKLLLAHFQADADDLRELANHRAQAAKEYLTGSGRIEAERVFLLAPRTAKAGEETKGSLSRVNFSLGAR